MKCMWIRKPTNDTAVVFVHGLMSNGEQCWQSEKGTYWPQLLKDEPSLSEIGIYIYSYKTSIFSGTYSLSDVVDDLKERIFNIDQVAEHRNIILVCHSMGGIIARKLLIEREADFCDRKSFIGLFLIASPSLGSSYANWLKPIAKFMGHTQADALRFAQDNAWLNDLDKSFLDLKEAGRVRLIGKELIEDNFIIFRKFWSKQVVEPFSGARYFPDRYKVPGSDHFSISKPEDLDSMQHRLLCNFVEEKFIDKVTEEERLLDWMNSTKSIARLHLPSTEYLPTESFDSTFMLDLMDDLTMSSKFWYRGSSGKWVAPYINYCRMPPIETRVIILDPSDDSAIRQRAADRKRTEKNANRAIDELIEELRREIRMAVISLFEARHRSKIHIFLSGAISSTVGIDLTDKAVYVGLHVAGPGPAARNPMSYRYENYSLAYSNYSVELSRQSDIASYTIKFDHNSGLDDLMEAFKIIGMNDINTTQINELRDEANKFQEELFKNMKGAAR